MVGRTNFTTWWCLETEMEDIVGDLIRELSWLKVHNVSMVGLHVIGVDSFI
jgi:hypothetical protein